MKIVNSFLYYKMAAFRCVIYMLIVGGTTLLSNTENYSELEWEHLCDFYRWRIYLGAIIAALGVLIAFLDQTMARLTTQPDENEDIAKK